MKIIFGRIGHFVFGLHSIFLVFLLTRGCTGENPSNSSCSSSQFTCQNKRCIPLSWSCDIDDDCGDNSDETQPNCETTCAENDFKCGGKGKCIPKRWTCDGDPDCDDRSDENYDHCKNRQCAAGEFKCHSGLCIPENWKCDGSPDCNTTMETSEDEKDCLKDEIECPKDEFKCDNGQCITLQWKCDFDKDCKDESDEKYCEPAPATCDPEEFQCSDGLCIKQSWVCDGDVDCNTDNSDERNCSRANKTCAANYFQCLSSAECIHLSWQCDKDPDCEDESDEEGCINTCRPDQFMCLTTQDCLSKLVQCDGNEDCRDGSDEFNCTNKVVCGEDEFDCGEVEAGETKCISRELVCDGTSHCPNFSDESPELACAHNPCDTNNGGCSQICLNLYRNKRQCQCRPGYALMNNSATVCTDLDECVNNHIHGACSQRCLNTKGSYKCECMDGYTLEHNRYCRAKDGKAELLLAERKELRRISLTEREYRLLLNESKIEGAIAMDFDYSEKKFYWTDVTKERIFSADLEDTTNVQVVVETGLNTPDGLAVDWINKYIYWTDTGFDEIGVATLDGKFRKTLINTNLDEPRAIALDPNNGYMFWTDWGKKPKIERCGLNGENRMVIVEENITWPNGITIDYSANRIYWIDAKLHTIDSADLDGGHRVTILKSHGHLKHPFAITVFEDYLYWTDWPSKSVRKYSKFGRKDEQVKEVVLHLHTPMDIHVLHPYRQQITRRFCHDNNGGCQHFCLAKALIDPTKYHPSQDHFTCSCADGYKLDSDMKSCIEMSSGATSVVIKPTVPTQPDSPNRSQNRSSTLGTSKSTPTVVETTHVEVTTVGSNYTAVTNEALNTPQHLSDESIGRIAGIVVGVLLVVILVVVVIGYVLYRKYSRGNGKSMNFDNPVYRKTTTDELIIEKNQKNLPQSMQPLTQSEHIEV